MDSATVLDPLSFSLDLPPCSRDCACRAAPGRGRQASRRGPGHRAAQGDLQAGLYRRQGDEIIIADGLTFTSRVLRVNLDTFHRFFAYVGTGGRELEAWVERKQDVLSQFYADAINEAVLHAAMTSFIDHLTEHLPVGHDSRHEPWLAGRLADPRAATPVRLLGDVQTAIGVELTPSLLMVPAKSVSGILFVPRRPSPVANCARARIVPTGGRRMTRGCSSGSTRVGN